MPDYENATYSIRKVGTSFELVISFTEQRPKETHIFSAWSLLSMFIIERMYITNFQERQKGAADGQ